MATLCTIERRTGPDDAGAGTAGPGRAVAGEGAAGLAGAEGLTEAAGLWCGAVGTSSTSSRADVDGGRPSPLLGAVGTESGMRMPPWPPGAPGGMRAWPRAGVAGVMSVGPAMVS